MARRKYIGSNDRFKAFSSKIIRVDEKNLKGYAALIKIEEISAPLIIGGTCLYDNGYSQINFLPDGEFWYLSAIYNENGNVIEWYFDITEKNALDEEGNPYCEDLFLDVALMPDGEIKVLDEEEIKDALDNGSITPQQFAMAYGVLNNLYEKKILNVEYMETFCSRLRLLLE